MIPSPPANSSGALPIGPPPKNGQSTIASAPLLAIHLPLRVNDRLGLRGVAAHAHVLAVRQLPAVQSVFLHRRDNGLALGMDNNAGMAALPLQFAGSVGLGGDEPERGAVVVGRPNSLAFPSNTRPVTVEGWVSSFSTLPDWSNSLTSLPALAAIRPSPVDRVGCNVLHPFPAELAISDTVPSAARRRSAPSSPPETNPSPVASGAKASTAPSCAVDAAPAPKGREARDHTVRRPARSQPSGRPGETWRQ